MTEPFGPARPIMLLIRRVVAERGVAVVVATHDASIIEVADRTLELSDGRVVGTVAA